MSDNAGASDAAARESRTTSNRLLSRHPVVLHLALRIGLGVLGLAMLAAAVVSLRRDNELGTVTVCLVGAAMVLVAALGRWPNRISWGDRSAEWAEEVLEQVVESGSEETRAEIVQAVRSVDDPKLNFLTAVATQGNMLSEAMAALIRAIPRDAVLDPAPVRDATGVRADLAIRPDASADKAHTIAVEVTDTRGGRRTVGLLDQAIRVLNSGYGAVLILTDMSAVSARDLLNLADHDWPVFVGSYREPSANLKATIREVLDFVSRSGRE